MDPQKENSSVNTNFESSAQRPEFKSREFEYPEEYRRRMKSTLDELDRVRQHGDENFNIGPTYHITNSQGEQLMVDTISVDYQDKNGAKHRKYYIVAQNIDGKIVGDRTTDVGERTFQGREYARAEGMLATGQRGGNIASSIEAVHQDILQREAQRIGKPVEWHISNVNLENLRDLQEEFRLNPTEDLRAQIEVKSAEQQRWQAVYGAGGKLGFDDSYTKSFSPTDLMDKHMPTGASVDLPPTDAELYKQSRKAVLDRVTSRMRDIASN